MYVLWTSPSPEKSKYFRFRGEIVPYFQGKKKKQISCKKKKNKQTNPRDLNRAFSFILLKSNQEESHAPTAGIKLPTPSCLFTLVPSVQGDRDDSQLTNLTKEEANVPDQSRTEVFPYHREGVRAIGDRHSEG